MSATRTRGGFCGRLGALVAAGAAIVGGVSGCGGSPGHAGTGTLASGTAASGAPSSAGTTLSSPAFANGARMPVEYSCSSANVSPPLHWTGRASSWAVTFEDRDAPAGTGVLWVVTGLPGSEHQLATGAVPTGAVVGRRSDGGTGYYGPCPPAGAVHHYVFALHALDGDAGVSAGTSAAEALAKIARHTTGQAALSVSFAR